jgi:hypothetical protein
MSAASGPTSSVWSHLLLFLVWGLNYVIVIPLVANITVTTSLVIYIASHRSLQQPPGEAEDARKEERAVLSQDDAYKMPIIASAALFSFYLAFKYFDKGTLNYVISVYFAVTGTLSLTPIFSPVVLMVVGLGGKPKQYVSNQLHAWYAIYFYHC